MNKTLENFLENLSDEDANEIHNYFDGNPESIERMICVLIDSHPDLIN